MSDQIGSFRRCDFRDKDREKPEERIKDTVEGFFRGFVAKAPVPADPAVDEVGRSFVCPDRKLAIWVGLRVAGTLREEGLDQNLSMLVALLPAGSPRRTSNEIIQSDRTLLHAWA